MKTPFLRPSLSKKSGLALWLLFHIGIPALFFFSLLFGPVSINTDLTKLMPEKSLTESSVASNWRHGGEEKSTLRNSAVNNNADAVFAGKTSREAVVLVAAPDFETAREGAGLLYEALKDSPSFETVSLYYDADSLDAIQNFIFENRFNYADAETVALLKEGGAQEIADDALAKAFGAFSFGGIENLARDPFMLSERRLTSLFSQALLSSPSMSYRGDVLAAKKDGINYVMLNISLAPGAVSLTNKKSGVREIYESIAAMKDSLAGVDCYYSGFPFHSYESSSRSQKEIAAISGISLILIVGLFLFFFRSLLPALLSALAALVSIAIATAAALLAFREIHIVTFVFGTSLIGASVDYSVHFFVRRAEGACGTAIRRQIFKSVTMSFASTEICFIALLFAPFAILRQFAVFAAAGLSSAYLTALCLYPVLPFVGTISHGVYGGGRRTRRWRLLTVIAAAATIFVLIAHKDEARIENKLSSFYRMEGFLADSETKAAEILDSGQSGFYYLVSGETAEEVLENEERLTALLETEIEAGNLRAYLAASAFVPSEKTQAETYRACAALLPLVSAQYGAYGFPSEFAETYRAEYENAAGRFVKIETAPLFAQALVSKLWLGEIEGAGGKKFYSAVLPLHPSNEKTFCSLADEFPSIYVVSKTKDIEGALDALTRNIFIIFCIAYFAIAALVFFFYGFRRGIKICAAPLFSVAASIAFLAASGNPVTFFSAAALILVFGMGLDYIFYMADENKDGRTVAAVWLSFLTTLLSFGALAFSAFPPVHTFGLTAAAGLGAAFLWGICTDI